jgi:hypothetical protein
VGEPICDYFVLMENTGDDHNFVTALLANFQDILVQHLQGFSAAADSKNLHQQMFGAQSLHGAAVSMCAPRVVAVIADFMVAAKKTNEHKAIEKSLRHLRNAVDELAGFLQALENGVPPSRAVLRQEDAIKRGSAAEDLALALDGAESPKDGSSLPGAVLDIDAAIQQAGGDVGFLCREVFPDFLQDSNACVASMVRCVGSRDLAGTLLQVNTPIHS